MINKKYLKLIRSNLKYKNNKFIYEKIAENITDSLDLVKDPFEKIIELGINENKIFKYLSKKMPDSEFIRCDIIDKKNIKCEGFKYIQMDYDINWLLPTNCCNLMYSNFFLHLTDNFEKLLLNVHQSLKSNGLFIASIPEISNFYQVKKSLIATDTFFYNGAFQRENKTININDILMTLKKLNFAIPVINTEHFTIEYKNFKKLLDDIRALKLSYCYNDKRNYFEKKNYINYMEEYYYNKFSNNKNFILDIKYNIITTWKN